MLLGVILLLFGYSYIPVYEGIGLVGVVSFQFYRNLIALLLLGLLWRRIKIGLRYIVIIGSVSLCAGACLAVGVSLTSPVTSAFITGGTILFIPLVNYLFAREKLRVKTAVMALLMVLGLFIFTKAWNMELSVGVVILLISDLCWAMQYFFIAKYGKRFSTESITFSVVLVATFGYLLSGVFTGSLISPVSVPVRAWGSIVVVAVVISVGCSLAQVYIQKKVSMTVVALVLSLEPLVTALLGFALKGTLLSGAEALGGSLMVGTALWYLYVPSKKEYTLPLQESKII